MRKILLPLLAVLILTACKKETVSEQPEPQEEIATDAAAKASDKITIWHYNATNNTWKQTTINANAWPEHQAHGDIWKVGQDYGGGKIAYILQQGDPGYDASVPHGFIAAPNDQSAGISWGCEFEIPGADGTALGTGMQNTIDVVTGCAADWFAAKLCYDLVLNGYSDWYLPSKDELNKLFLNKFAIGGFASYLYQSSTEYSAIYIWGQVFDNYGIGALTYGVKYSNRAVRAVRSF